MITIAEYIDAVGMERKHPRVTLSPEAMEHAERFFREYAEELAEAAIHHAIRACELMQQRPFEGAHMAKSRKPRLQSVLGDPKPLIDPPSDSVSSSK